MIQPGLYRHYKGPHYRFLGLAVGGEAEEPLVVYHRDGDTRLWVRPLAMWSERVEVNGEWVPRFVYVGE